MFLRKTKRIKDGKEHRYWSVVENRRVPAKHTVQKTLVVYRLLDPGSEWKLHRSWFDNSAMADLLEDNFRLAAKDTLYRCHDLLLEHKNALFTHLKDRWTDLLDTTCDILLYDFVIIPTTDGREFRMKRYTRPADLHRLILSQLGMALPNQPPPEISNPVVKTS